MKSLLKHFNIDRNKFRKILAIFILIKIIEITLIALISKNFLFVLVIELLLNYGLAYYIFHLFLFGGSSSLITRYNCWRFGLEISKIFGAQLEDFKKLIYEVLFPINYNLMVTPKEIDFIIDKLSLLIGNGINKVLHKSFKTTKNN